MGKTNRGTPRGGKFPDGGGGGRQSRPERQKGSLPRDIQISKKLSWVLRHGAQTEGLKLDAGGYVNVGDLLRTRLAKSIHLSFEEVKHVVHENEKKRFGLLHVASQSDRDTIAGKENASEQAEATAIASRAITEAEDIHPHRPSGDDAATEASAAPTSETKSAQSGLSDSTESALANPDIDPSHYLIRANQGHSIKLADMSALLTPITLSANNIPNLVIHGTRQERWFAILESGGLKPMKRQHVHFATGMPPSLQFQSGSSAASADATVDDVKALPEEQQTPEAVSGMRTNCTLLVFLDCKKALQRGMELFISENGVVLTEGLDGVVPVEFFERVEEKGGRVLVAGGRVVAECSLPVGFGATGGKKGKAKKPMLNVKENGDGHEDG